MRSQDIEISVADFVGNQCIGTLQAIVKLHVAITMRSSEMASVSQTLEFASRFDESRTFIVLFATDIGVPKQTNFILEFRMRPVTTPQCARINRFQPIFYAIRDS